MGKFIKITNNSGERLTLKVWGPKLPPINMNYYCHNTFELMNGDDYTEDYFPRNIEVFLTSALKQQEDDEELEGKDLSLATIKAIPTDTAHIVINRKHEAIRGNESTMTWPQLLVSAVVNASTGW